MAATALRLREFPEVHAPETSGALRIVIPSTGSGGPLNPEPTDDPTKAWLVSIHDEVAGCTLQLRLVLTWYNRDAAQRGWPILTDRMLCRELRRLGCDRVQLDLRSVPAARRQTKYGGVTRPTMIVFPEELP